MEIQVLQLEGAGSRQQAGKEFEPSASQSERQSTVITEGRPNAPQATRPPLRDRLRAGRGRRTVAPSVRELGLDIILSFRDLRFEDFVSPFPLMVWVCSEKLPAALSP